MRLQTAMLAVALGLGVAGCGQQSTPRQEVAAYLTHVNRIESELSRPLETVTTAGRQFAQEQGSGGTLTNLVTSSHEQALLGALSQITAVRARLAAIRAPAAAANLRGLLLQIVDGEAELTREVARLVDFLPRFNAALRPLAPATRSLEHALSQPGASGSSVAAEYAAKAAALRRFKHAVDGVVSELRGLQPPAVSRPQYETQLAALRGMSTSSGRLATAIADGPQGNVQPLLTAFDRAATLNQTISAQKAEIAAIRAYDDQSTRLARLSQAAEEERLRLANTLS
jgi:hypothetical protein